MLDDPGWRETTSFAAFARYDGVDKALLDFDEPAFDKCFQRFIDGIAMATCSVREGGDRGAA